MLLEHKTAVIYGAAGAIGGAVARAFAHEGADLFLAGRTRARVESVAGEISAAGGVAEAAEVDALDEDAIEKHMDHVVARAQKIDVLFNPIGMDDVQGTLLVDMSAEDFAQPVIKATRTQFLTARAAARRMLQQGSGVIMSITVAPTPVPHHGGYGVACAAVEGLGRSFAAELPSMRTTPVSRRTAVVERLPALPPRPRTIPRPTVVRVGVAFAIGDLSEAGESQSIPLVNLARVLTGGVLTLLGARVRVRRIETGKAIFRSEPAPGP